MQPDNTPNNGEKVTKDLQSNKSKDNIEYKAEQIVTKLVEVQGTYEPNPGIRLPETIEAEIVNQATSGVPVNHIAKQHGVSNFAVNEKLRMVMERANNPNGDILKKGLKQTMAEVASLSTQELHERIANEGDRIPTPVLGVVAGIMTQRMIELEKMPTPQSEPDWGKLSETDNGQDIVPDDNIRLD